MDTEEKSEGGDSEKPTGTLADTVGELVVSAATVLAHTAAQAVVGKVKKAAEGTDAAAIKTACDELMQASQALAQHMHANKDDAPEGGTAAAGAKGDDDDVIDAEFEKK